MIQNNLKTGAIKFISYKKREGVKEEIFLQAYNRFEKTLESEENISFHGLFINLQGELSQVLAASDLEVLMELVKRMEHHPDAKDFFDCIDFSSIRQWYHTIQDPNFSIPSHFGCFEHGTLKTITDGSDCLEELNLLAKKLYTEYLAGFSNTKAHTWSATDNGYIGELVFGENVLKTREVCFGYFNVEIGKKWLGKFDLSTAELGFWSLLG